MCAPMLIIEHSHTLAHVYVAMTPANAIAAVTDEGLWRRVRTLATLEFDRNRKSMSTIVSAASSSSGSGSDGMRLTRQAARQQSGQQLLVKGAAEFMLQRCSQVGRPAKIPTFVFDPCSLGVTCLIAMCS